jgi:HEPN domain-containing protein/predicted nucleotidyltransferase
MIREEFDVDMIILFGSYARGDWVEELGPDQFYYKYQSDFDVLVVADREDAKKHYKWDRLEACIRRSSVVPTPVVMIHHSTGFLNERLSEGHYFFTDIIKEGILLYDSKRFELAEARELTPEEYKNKATRYFNHWFSSASGFFENFRFSLSRNEYNISAFLLHQAVERFYSALLLVLTDYKPKTHDIEKLGQFSAAQDRKLLEVFPKGTEDERRRFELLRKAYVDARYDENYSITREDLEWLAERVSILQELTEKICKERIESFK